MSQPRQKRSFIGLLPGGGLSFTLSEGEGEGHFITLLRPETRPLRLARRLQHLFALLKVRVMAVQCDRLGVV